MTNHFSTDQIEVMCIADTIDLKEAANQFTKSFVATQYRDVLHIDIPRGHFFIFDYGVIVSWGISEPKKALLMQELSKFSSTGYSVGWEIYKFVILPDEQFCFRNDVLTLENGKTHTLLAVSHAFAQSRKLEVFESKAQKSIDDNRYLTEELIDKGNISLNRKDLARLRGALFQTKSDIMSRFSLLDIPEYFWDYPETQEQYLSAAHYLELSQRHELLNFKLQTIHELFDMLAAEQNHKHSSFLEWIIIILIAVEIVLFFVE